MKKLIVIMVFIGAVVVYAPEISNPSLDMICPELSNRYDYLNITQYDLADRYCLTYESMSYMPYVERY